MQQPGNRISDARTPRGLRDTPLMVLAGVVAFVVTAILLAGLLLSRNDDPDPSAGGAANKLEATATASSTSRATVSPTTMPATSTATHAGSTGAVDGQDSLTATAEPTSFAPQLTDPAEPEPATTTDQPGDEPSDDLIDILPGLEELPDGYVMTNEGSLALDELTALHPDPATQRERLLGWGFTGATERQFEPASLTDAAPEDLRFVATLVVAFRRPEGARAAVEAAHADAQAAENTDIDNAEIEPLGDLSLAASGILTINGETLRVAYVIVQLGDRAITFAGSAPSGDPLSIVLQIASKTLNSL